jgi:hypothetical protein
MTCIGMILVKWISSTTNVYSLDIAINIWGHGDTPPGFDDDKLSPLRAIATFMFIPGLGFIISHCIPFWINKQVDRGIFSKRWGYGAIGLLIAISGAVITSMSIIYIVISEPVCRVNSSITPSINQSSVTRSY